MTYVDTYLIRGLLRCRPTQGRDNINNLSFVLKKKRGTLKTARFMSQEFLSSKMDVLCFDLQLCLVVDADKKRKDFCVSLYSCVYNKFRLLSKQCG